MEIEGVLERIVYYNETDGYLVGRFNLSSETLKSFGVKELKGLESPKQRTFMDFQPTTHNPQSSNSQVTIVGNLLSISAGESLRLSGSFEEHPKHGMQFKVKRYETLRPATTTAIEKYLGSGLIKGIGPVTAKRLVDHFGAAVLEILDEEPEKLSQVSGVGDARVAMIKEGWQEQKEIKNIMLFLQGKGVSSNYSVKIYKQYGDASIATVEKNPYKLAEDIWGIGFKTADAIASKMGFGPTSKERVRAGIEYALSQISEQGHLYASLEDISSYASKFLEIEPSLLPQALEELISSKRVYQEKAEKDEEAIYLAPFYQAEKGVSERLKNLLKNPLSIEIGKAKKALEFVKEKYSLKLSSPQEEAVLSAVSSRIFILTGGPGTGKTTTVTTLVRLLQYGKRKVLLASPTGRAAKRLNEVTGVEAQTIHRLLEFSPESRGFQRNEDNPLDADVVIVDEASMIDVLLANSLLKAISPHSQLILIGDVDQLPSVGPGNFLRDLIASKMVPVVKLSQVFRQADTSLIVKNAHRINRGDFPYFSSRGSKGDFYFIEEENPEEVVKVVVELSSEKIPKAFGYNPFRDIQVLCPLNRGTVGANNLNLALQEKLNPDIKVAQSPKLSNSQLSTPKLSNFRERDKVIQLRNNYEKEVFNGDIGWIAGVNSEDREVVVDFMGRQISYDYNELDELRLAYAISVHKSQGSEYPCVVLPILTQHYVMLARNLLYTAVTRAKKLVVVVGTKKALVLAIKNDREVLRKTGLVERLKT